MVKSSVEYSEQLYVLSQRTGISVEALSQLNYAAGQVDMSIEELANGVKFLERNAYNAEQGNIKLESAFRNLGVSVKDSNGQLKTGTELLMAMADKFKNMPDGPQKTAIAMQLMGRSGIDMIPILNQGSAAIKEMAAQADELGATVSKEADQSFKSFGDDVKSMDTALGGLTRTISAGVIPVIDNLVKFITWVVVGINNWEKQHPILSQAINVTALALGALLAIIGAVAGAALLFGGLWPKLVASFGAVLTSLSAVGAGLVAFLFNPITLIVGAVILLAAAWVNNWGNIRKVVEDAAKAIGSVLDWINEKALWTTMFLQNIATNLKNNWQHPIDAVKDSINQANAAINALNASGGGTNFGTQFLKGVKTAEKATDDWIAKLRNLITVHKDLGRASDELENHVADNSSQELTWGQILWKGWVDAATGAQTRLAQGINGTIGALGTLGNALQGAAAQNKQFATAAKAVAIGMAIMNTAQGITKALAEYPWPWSMIVAALVGAAGAIQIETIASQGFAEGTDTVPSMLSPGEMVIPRTFSDAIRSGSLSLSGPQANNNTTNNQKTSVVINFSAVVNHEVDLEKASEKLGRIMEAKLRGVR
jgi:hypothetical protein